MIRACCIIGEQHIASFNLKKVPRIGAPFNYDNGKGVFVKNGKVAAAVLTVFDYIDSSNLTATPVYNVVIEAEESSVSQISYSQPNLDL